MNSYRINYAPVRRKPRPSDREIRAWWYGLPRGLRSPMWPTAFSVMTILALLMGFHQVVQSAVKQGELLRMSASTHAKAERRCHALQGERMRASCMNQINSPPTELAGRVVRQHGGATRRTTLINPNALEAPSPPLVPALSPH